MLTTIAVQGYRSLRELVLPLAALTVITGSNGSGKSSLYRSLRLLAAASRDGAIGGLAAEGGLPSTLWAGPETITRAVRQGGPTQGTRRSTPVSLRLGFASDTFGYAIDFGLPQIASTAFGLDPEIKTEAVWSGDVLRPATLLSERRGGLVRLRSGGEWADWERTLPAFTSMLSEVGDPVTAPELLSLRDTMRSWRFYDHVRTDANAPAREPRIGTRTPVLSSDGGDLAAALQTIRELGHAPTLDAAIERAFPGSRLEVQVRDGRFGILLHQAGLLRPLEAAELSDGTLRYLLWIAALLSPRPAELLVLNEPETSLHPGLLAPLAELIAVAGASSQVLVVTHSRELLASLYGVGALVHELEKQHGETVVSGREGLLDAPAWTWPKR